jgi:hypothetical protein
VRFLFSVRNGNAYLNAFSPSSIRLFRPFEDVEFGVFLYLAVAEIFHSVLCAPFGEWHLG